MRLIDKSPPQKELEELGMTLLISKDKRVIKTLKQEKIKEKLEQKTFAKIYLALFYAYHSKKLKWKFRKKDFLVLYSPLQKSSNPTVARIFREMRDLDLLQGGSQQGPKTEWIFQDDFFEEKYYKQAQETIKKNEEKT